MVVSIILIAYLCCGFPGTLLGAGATVIDLKAEAVIAGDTVTLGDLATIEGANALTVSGISIMSSPGGRLGGTLSARTIAEKVRSEYRRPVHFKGAEQVHISVRTATVTKEILEKIFIEEVIKQSPWKETGKVEVDQVRVPRCPIVRDADPIAIQAKFSPHEDFLGFIMANLIIGSGPSPERVTVSGRVRLLADVPVVCTRIKTGRTISSSDLVMRIIDISSCPRAYTRQENCVGKRAKVTLREGKPILPSQVERKPDVCSGEWVFIEARINNLVVRDRGIALKDGYQGEPIPVRNVASGKQVVGTIIAASLVQVEL
jgi:flagella basal body P-ring formation protein FlgA